MGLISKTDLYYKDYSWTVYSDDNSKITGEPDNTLLNRKEGYEILYFVNKFSEINEFKLKASATKTERMIREDVPSDIRSQENINNWLVKNWEQSKF